MNRRYTQTQMWPERLTPIAVFIALLISVWSVDAQRVEKNEWQGLIPLRSTRADVEKLLGKPKLEDSDLYETENEAVSIWYASGTCREDNRSVWNVPKDTVTRIVVAPKKDRDISFLVNGFWQSFEKVATHVPGVFTYWSDDGSIMFETKVQRNGVEEVTLVKYLPKKSDAGCNAPKRSKGSP